MSGKSSIESFMYGLTMRGDWIADTVARVWFRWYCPYPIIDDHLVKACIAAGHCGCNNHRLLDGKEHSQFPEVRE